MKELLRRWLAIAPDLRSFRRQVVLLAAVVSGLAAVALVLVVQLILGGLSARTADQVLSTRTDAVVNSVRTASTVDTVKVPPGVLDVGVAVYDGAGRLIAGRPHEHLSDAYQEAQPGVPQQARSGDEPYRLLARDFTTPGGGKARVVMVERLAPYEQAERYALLLSLAAGVVLVAATTAVAAWASRLVLRPVTQMARIAEDWSEHDLSQRFDLGAPTNEIAALGATLDGLLDKVAKAIRTEQQLTGELAHELRTPLAAADGNAQLLAGRSDLSVEAREDVDEIQAACRRMADTISSLLELARTGMVRSDVSVDIREVLDHLLEELPATVRPRVSFEQSPTDQWAIAVTAPLAVRTIFPLVDNALRYGRFVRILVDSTTTHCVVNVDDDGPGLDEAVRAHAFEPGRTTGGGAGLGLPLARRIARSVGGNVVAAAPPVGWSTRFTVTLPLAATVRIEDGSPVRAKV